MSNIQALLTCRTCGGQYLTFSYMINRYVVLKCNVCGKYILAPSALVIKKEGGNE